MLDIQQDRTTAYRDAQNRLDILKILSISQVETSLANQFNRAFTIFEFKLGDEISIYNVAPDRENFVRSEQEGFYVILNGRVRLLGRESAGEGKEVSLMVLEMGDSFGIESLYANILCLKSAIAACDCQIVWMPLVELQSWLEKIPELSEYLCLLALSRQCLIFFKTSTNWRRFTFPQLNLLIPYLVETKILAGEGISAYPESGHFWLYSGEIESKEGGELSPPQIGDSWGYPDAIPEDWVAKTDLVVYRLPTENWEAALAIAPIVTINSPNKPDSNRQDSPPINKKIAPKINTPISHHFPTADIQSNTEIKDNRDNSGMVEFPQPKKRSIFRIVFWQNYPFIQQQSSSDCGAACLAMIGQYWGKRLTLHSLRNIAGVGRSGASLKGLSKAAESLGFQTSPVRASLNRLAQRHSPWIAHWEGNHYIVVYHCQRDRVLIADPAVGKRKLSRKDFLAGWTGYALLLEPTAQLAATANEKISLNRYWGLLFPYRSIIGQIILASLLFQVFGLITPLFTQIILDRVVTSKSIVTLQVFSLGLILFGIWSIGLSATRQYLLDYFANRLDLTFISGFINHTLSLPLKFFESRQVGDIITRVQETQKIQTFLTRQAVLTWLDAMMAFVYIGLMVYYNWQLTILVLLLIPPIVILTVVASPLLRQLSRDIFKEDASQNSLVVEMISGVATVKSAGSEQEVRWRWEERLTNMLNVRFKAQNLGNFLQSVGGLINTIGSTALLWYGATLVIQEQLTIGQFVAFNMLIGKVIEPILRVVKLWDEFQEILVSVERLDDVFTSQPEENPQQPLMVLPQLRGEVTFEKVSFRYSEDEETPYILQNLSFKVAAGQTIAIVGRSGSGKSTLVRLLQDLYHPTIGRICIDGHDIRHVSPQSLRSQLGVVPQECFLFSGTILENITLYRAEFSLEQVIEVAKLAEAHAFIQSLSLGYNTRVGERGSNLSGGQRQRIAIARALLGDPRIIILDEATSSLDTESERRFQQNLARISRDRTTFIIAHRLSTVRNADSILVLDRGILVEEGNHDELMALQGIYCHLAQQQLDL
ncbi:MAG TPA: peptidase C39 [Cyanobacteria bacterium UBA11149]|nr:peptidase C39 [Cyanobacteria bacterium UBA11367]HBE59336.1 peptidase C39 [Cyanobacteria bacterium UBA11366]HBR76564.1 peptidase C39 [Cyanobacteria bacterium UBA11159]HBS72009.1 peptidase C39 [Cyanobacteria bacterium UBA11153]HBW92193.1 peptidase C39 [Cyanobacteria bacterium UBA11149]HCA97303.1 peptidase C39 [Cyanobacteria bacterium UBA9226]